MNFDHPVVIVGAGPAGLATALHLAQLHPSLATDSLILDAAEHPRPKLCGGGITFHGEEQLARLHITADVPGFQVTRLLFRLDDEEFETACPRAMRVIERADFDAALAAAAQARGLRLRGNERVVDIAVDDDGAVVETTRRRYRTRVVVAADGANSTVRRKLGLRSTLGVARLLRVMTPVDPQQSTAWREQTAVFDFSCVRHGVQGYVWDFPCYVGGQPFMNRGIFDSRVLATNGNGHMAHGNGQPVYGNGTRPQTNGRLPHGNLKQTFAAALDDRGFDLEALNLEGHPVRWFNRTAEFSRPHVLLVGDAAGVDALFAEGISYALEYGQLAAASIVQAFAQRDFSFAGYREQLFRHRLSRSLARRAQVARRLYRHRHPWLWSWLWRAAAVAPGIVNQSIGAALDVLPPPDIVRR
ncbi:MAG: NAD(P)/FAD-dependent oxidoreductase [Caldilineaceae bacterium]